MLLSYINGRGPICSFFPLWTELFYLQFLPVIETHRWLDGPKQHCFCKMSHNFNSAPNVLYFQANKHFHFLQVGVYFFIYLIPNEESLGVRIKSRCLFLSTVLIYITSPLICMCLTSGLTEFNPIRIHCLPTITGCNWYNVLRYSSAAHFHRRSALARAHQVYTVLTLIRCTRPALHFKLSSLSELNFRFLGSLQTHRTTSKSSGSEMT